MSQWNNTPATYTSFTPHASELQGSNSLFSRLFKRGKDDSDVSSESGSIPSSREVSVERSSSRRSSVDKSAKTDDSAQSDQSNKNGGSPKRLIKQVSIQRPTDQAGGSNSDELSDQSTNNKSSDTDQRESNESTRRTFSSVITRLSTIVERRTSTPQVYRDSDFKQYWMPDSSCKECYDCGDKFTTFRRRHHCRICGQIFCNACCNQELSGKVIGYKGSIRVCTYCHQIVQNYAQKASPSGDPKVTKETLDKCLDKCSQPTELLSPEQALNRSNHDFQSSLNLRSPGDSETNLVSAAPFDLTPQSEFVADNFTTERRLLIQDSTQLRNLWSLILDTDNGVEFQSYRFRLRTYPKCIAGNKLVDWLLKQDKVANRIQAIAIGQALIDADYLDPLLNMTTPFRDDFTLYKPTEITSMDSTLPIMDSLEESIGEDSAPQWFQEIQDNTQDADKDSAQVGTGIPYNYTISDLSQDSTGKIRVDESHFEDQISKPTMPEDVTEPIFGDVPVVSNDQEVSGSWRTLSIATDNTEEKETFDKIQQDHHEHLTMLTKQLLSEEGLTAAWVDIIISTVDRVSLFVKPDVRFGQDDADIRKYVHIKKVPGDKRSQTGLIHGVVFNKNIAHKKMCDSIQNPGVLLLEGTIEYQRVENKMSSLQPQILQEEEFLRKFVAKIAALRPKPDVLVVEKSVSRLAQDYLLKHNITLIYNVKRSVMERLSRFLQTDIAPSVDSLLRGQTNRQTLGFCHTFSVRNYKLPSGDTKTMICFDGCATHLGCDIILRGGTLFELKRVKKIMNFMIYASYHSRLETAFCMDEFLKPTTMADSLIEFDMDTNGYNEHRRSVGVVSGKSSLGESGKAADSKIVDDIKLVISDEEEKCLQALEVSDKSRDVHDNSGCEFVEHPTSTVEVGTKTSDEAKQVSKTEAKEEDRISSFIRCNTIDEIEHAVEDSLLIDSNQTGQSASGSNNLEQSNVTFSLDGSNIDSNPLGQSNSKVCDMFNSNSTSNEMNQSNLSSENVDQSNPACDKKVSEDNKKSTELDNVRQNGISEGRTETICIKDADTVSQNDEIMSQSDQGKLISTQTLSNNASQSPGMLRRTSASTQKRQSEVIQLTDHSDPLHNYQKNQDESIFHSSLALQEQLQSHRFKLKSSLENVVLSVSPYIKYDLPYLETEAGSKCELRPFFPEEIYWSSHFGYKNGQSKPRYKYQDDIIKKYEPPTNIKIVEAHEFIRCQLNKPAWDKETQENIVEFQIGTVQNFVVWERVNNPFQYMLAKYRAYGGRINIHVNDTKTLKSKTDMKNQSNQSGNQSGKGRQPSGDTATKGDHLSKDSGVMWEKKIDCLDPLRHQRLAVLFSSFSYESENHPNPCVYPWIVTMDFYGRNDITLGGFLERFCFRQSYVCPSDSCNTPMEKHIRRFVHGQGSVSVVLKRVNKPLKDGQTNILVWSWCHKCKQVTPVVPLSSESWHMSFSKYLEFRFHGNNYKCRTSVDPCTHSLHHDHFQYFGFHDMVASFKYSTIKMKEIKLPPLVISKVFQLEVIELYRIKDEVKRLTMKITEQFSSILDFMTKMKAETNCEILIRLINESNADQQNERTAIRELAHKIRDKVTILLQVADNKKILILNQENKQIYNEIEDDMIQLKRTMAEAVLTWNNRLQEVYMQQKKSKQTSGQRKDKDREGVSVSSSVTVEILDQEVKTQPSSMVQSSDLDTPINSPLSVSGDIFQPSSQDFHHRRQKSENSILSRSPPVQDHGKSDHHHGKIMEISWNFVEEVSSQSSSAGGSLDMLEDTADDTLTAPQQSEVTGTDDDKDRKGEITEEISSTTITTTTVEKLVTPEVLPSRKSPADEQLEGTAGDKIGALKKTLMNTIWQGSGAYQLVAPFDAYEHYLLPPCSVLPVVVYDHEPSSIIAYSLSCPDYHSKLHEIQTCLTQSQKHAKPDQDSSDKPGKEEGSPVRKQNSGKLSFFKGGGKDKPDTQSDVVRYIPRPDSGNIESPQDETDFSMFTGSTSESTDRSSKSIKQTTNSHIELQFSDNTARFYCKIYFAEQFRQLRKLIFPEGEDVYIRSLCRCKPWEAKGGKSGSSFCKTDDDRFILKQMSGMEVESFEKFGPKYFQYILKAEKHQRPTALAKIVGVYRIGFRNQQTNNAMKQDLIVLENLFYNRSISQTFDLKGSERNRLVKPTRKGDEEMVLLDENFLRVSVDCPLYMLPHSKTMLMMAIGHDSQFLSSNLVMDYSLLVGLDEQRKELVVGIIDYIRTFTWDKKLETILKSNFGGQGKMPTVVSPEVYRTRFHDAMSKYFLSVPDQWSGLGKDVDI